MRKLSLFYTLIKEKAPSYLFQVILQNNTPYTKKSVQKSEIPFFQVKNKLFKNYFFPTVRPEPNEVFNVDVIKGLKFLTRIRLGLSQLAGHNIRHNF